MGAYVGPYIPGVDVAVSSGGGDAVGAPRLHSGLQCRLVGRLETRGGCHCQDKAHAA